ncbi:hypothetical protein [Methyloversatilis sp.]|uniref:hypothetical protein n=1 Tax=Methyloversatilis sp. TaxID=2569862 RepID=UPI0027376051|nr:hypothetical protein [Methyloversatilis sp.]MDP2867763.1 hypothetical protein [Methyloversatilis sp.]MDP3288013.1 hypothetical protein [Methyloversatilis sp.]MDP3455472.1 hypothetical protein [Methyloversatilis sp.]MDP3577639.1 hypothetical protein [Methyloversatilis sp.]
MSQQMRRVVTVAGALWLACTALAQATDGASTIPVASMVVASATPGSVTDPGASCPPTDGCPACPPTAPPLIVCAQPPDRLSDKPPDDSVWALWGKDASGALIGILFGTLLSLYVTVVFDRYKRFRETLIDIAQARLHNDAYPMAVTGLQPVRDAAVGYAQLLERKQWTLDTDGHLEAAAEVGKLTAFARLSALCIENLLHGTTRGLTPDAYLAAFQGEYNRINGKHFVQFEQRLVPDRGALLQPWPRPPAPVARKVVPVDFFDLLLG